MIESDNRFAVEDGEYMKMLTATVVARSFSVLLDGLEHGGEEITITRNKQPVARLVPGTPRMNAIEALGDIYATLDDTEGAAWLADTQGSERLRVAEARDPWE